MRKSLFGLGPHIIILLALVLFASPSRCVMEVDNDDGQRRASDGPSAALHAHIAETARSWVACQRGEGGTRCSRRQVFPAGVVERTRYVYCTFSITEINKVDGVEQSFYVDGLLTCYYQEPALVGAVGPGVAIRLPSETETILRQSFIFVDPLFSNQRTAGVVSDRVNMLLTRVPDPIAPIIASLPNPHWPVNETPWLGMSMRVSGLFKAVLELRDFPFDEQQVQVNMSSFNPAEFVHFTRFDWLDGFSMTAKTQDVIGWDIVESAVVNSTQFFSEYGLTAPTLHMSVRLKRVPTFYTGKIVVGVTFLTAMAIGSFVIDPRDTNRIMIAMTAFFGIVSFLFVISNDVPKVAYLTRMDRFVNASFYFVMLTFTIHSAAYIAIQHIDDAAEAKRATEKRDDSATAPDDEGLGSRDAGDRGRPANADEHDAFNPIALMRSLDAGLFAVALVSYAVVTGTILAGY